MQAGTLPRSSPSPAVMQLRSPPNPAVTHRPDPAVTQLWSPLDPTATKPKALTMSSPVLRGTADALMLITHPPPLPNDNEPDTEEHRSVTIPFDPPTVADLEVDSGYDDASDYDPVDARQDGGHMTASVDQFDNDTGNEHQGLADQRPPSPLSTRHDAIALDVESDRETIYSTVSLDSSDIPVFEFHGRTYTEKHWCAFSEQPFLKPYLQFYRQPCDDEQNKIDDMTHEMMLFVTQKRLYQAPLKPDIQTVLDIGTGTGIWAMGFADEFPGASVTGIDLASRMPSWIPPNCKFEIADACLDWTFKKDSFDFIHIRFLPVGPLLSSLPTLRF